VPLYEYQCDTHGHRFEARHGMREQPVQSCPECGAPVHRVIHPVGIVFKGSGFYATDSRKSGATSEPAEGKSESPGEPKPESKSEPATEKAG